MVFTGADVQDGRSGTGPVDRQFDRPGHILDVGEVAALATVAVDDDRLARLDLAAEVLQSEVWALAWTPDREEPQGEESQAVEAGVESAPLLAVEFGQRVGAARVGGGRFLGG